MTPDAIQEARQLLEEAIGRMVTEFERTTEMEVFNIHIRPKNFTPRIAVAVKLPDIRAAKIVEVVNA